mgnify:CR=1 FL=1
MKLRWSLTALGMSVALGLTPARAENEFLAPVVRVMADGGAVAQPPAVNCADGGCQPAAGCGGTTCTVFTPQMIGNDLVTNVYAGNVFNNRTNNGYGLLAQPQRGSFKISDNESPAPVDRWFLTYTYFNRVTAPALQFGVVQGPNGPGIGLVPQPVNTDVHRETFGFEKTFLNGDASIGIRMGVVQQDGDIQNDSFSDTTIIGKYYLIKRDNLLVSVGLAVTAPTGVQNPGAFGPAYRSVLFQPYSGFIWNRDRIYVHGFNSTIFSTNDNDPSFGTYDLGIGYRLYQVDDAKDRWLTYIIPTGELHANIPVTKEGWAGRTDFALPDNCTTTLGVHFGLCGKANLTIGAGCPVSGPKLYDVSGIAQLNWRF